MRTFSKYIPSKKKKSEIIEKKIFFFFTFDIALAFILFFMVLLVDIRNLIRKKRLLVEKTIFCGLTLDSILRTILGLDGLLVAGHKTGLMCTMV
jgi:hypothetical protein